jgi:NAD(P)H dehydrogenase (quinone)
MMASTARFSLREYEWAKPCPKRSKKISLKHFSFVKDRDGAVRPALLNINKLGAVCTYGAGRLATMIMGDPPRRVVKRLVRAMTGHHVRCDYLALYDMNRTTPERRASFQGQVVRVFESW